MPNASDRAFHRYLGLLGWVGDPGLFELVRSHVIRVPFENIGRLLALAGEAPDELEGLDSFLVGACERSLGGAYFAGNLNLALLLRFLDYEVDILPAKVGGKGHAHAVLRLTHEGEPWLIDVSCGVPLYEPIPLARGLPVRIAHGDIDYVLDRHPLFKETVELSAHTGKNGARKKKKTIYAFKKEPARAEDFVSASRKVYGPQSSFMKELRLTRIFDGRVLEVRNDELIITAHGKTSRQKIHSLDELEMTVQELMLLDRCPVRRAVEVLAERQGVRLVN